MPKLRINLLGPIEVKLEDQLVTGFDFDKVRALLAFLAVEVDRPHRREALAGLLWPEHPERSARTSLRRALTNLRQLINDSTTDPPYLSITRQTIQFNSYSDYTLDAELLSRGADAIDKADGNVKRLEEIVKSYRGSFLEGFSLPDSAAFEEWLILTRETYELSISKIYKQLAKTYDQLGLVEKSLEILKKQVLLDPWDEQTQRQIMYLMAASGRRGDAVAHYEQFSELLIREIGVEPDQDTSDLLASIKSGQIKRSDDLIQAKSIRGYELRERLGAGSFGIVFRAYQPSVKRDVAIKLIRPEFANQPDFIRRFDVEAEIIARMEHPYIVPIYDYWREPEGAFLVMRWLQGGSLKDALVQGPWHAAACADLLDELAAALDAAHRQGIIHRDIKPANILLDGDNHGYLSDFGIATLAETVQVSGITPMTLADSRLSGTPEYISPEQAMNEPITL
jgi:DNA-binding SARP family transcriptional activator